MIPSMGHSWMVNRRSDSHDRPRRRKNPARVYVSNRLYEWRWMAVNRIDRARGRDPLHRHRGRIIGLTDYQDSPPEDPT